jgi:hypothetical protein
MAITGAKELIYQIVSCAGNKGFVEEERETDFNAVL